MKAGKKREITVLHVLSSAGIAGGERYLQDLIKYADKSIKHLVILPYHGLFTQVLKDLKYHYTIVNMERKFSIRSILSLVQYVKKNKVDIVHTHGYRANFYGRIACMIAGVKSVCMVGVSLYDYIDTPIFRRHIYMMLERIMSDRTGIFICVSNAMKRDMLRLGIDPQKAVVIQNGVDLERFYPRAAREKLKKELGIGRDGPVVGTVGRMVTEKGQIYLIDALKYLKGEWKTLKCLFVGEGPMLPRLKKMAFDSGMEDICVFAGIRKDIEQIYPILDVFVLPSLREPFGLVLLEAMASGVPVIATASGGPLEFIRPDANGALVPAADSKALAWKISHLLSNKDKAKEIAKEGRKTVEDGFNVKRTVKMVEDIYIFQHQAKDPSCNVLNKEKS